MDDTTLIGLSSVEAQQLLNEYGPNALPEKKPPSNFQIFIAQLKSPLVYILLISAVITFFLNQHEDTVIILVAVILNTILGYYQESKAGKALEALKKLLHPHAHVLRDGNKQLIDTADVVPTDLVLLSNGDKVPADGEVVEANRLFLMEAILTGESVAIAKQPGDKVLMGTIVTGGKGIFKVEKTGAHTMMGEIASHVQGSEELTPLQKQLAKFSKLLSIVVLCIIVIVFLFGYFTGKPLLEIFTTSVALAVGAIPEGLLVALTVVLAIGMQKILKRKGLVKNLVSAETLGGVTTICSDKTGTLTMGQMEVVRTIGDHTELVKQMYIANDLDNAVALAAEAYSKEYYTSGRPERLDSIPFTSENKYFASLHEYDDQHNIIYINGAPEMLLDRSTIDDHTKYIHAHEIKELTGIGYRTIGYAQKLVSKDKRSLSADDLNNGLTWIGFICMSDPVRPDVKESLIKAHEAGIKMIVITGDYAKTAQYIIQQLGIRIKPENVMLGGELASMSDQDLSDWLAKDERIKLFARTKPEQKMRIVDALKHNDEIVAMMGDGVNDAPALKKADIGIVVGEASDVAKESADLILLDSSFSTIVAAIEEGRTIFDNIRKVILYLMSDAFVEIFAILIAMAVGYPLPITAAQILWINLVSDGLPNLALTVDPSRPNIMKYRPRSPKEPLVAGWMNKLIGLVSLTGAVGGFLLYMYVLNKTGDIHLARSVSYVTFGVNSLVYVLSIRALGDPIRKTNPFNNKWLWFAIIGGFGFLVAPFIFTGLGNFLDLVWIGKRWFGALGVGLAMVTVIELYKHQFSHHLHGTDILFEEDEEELEQQQEEQEQQQEQEQNQE